MRPLALLLAVGLLTGCAALRHAAAPPPSPSPSAVPAPTVPARSFYLGVGARGFPSSWSPVIRFEKAVGRPVNLVLMYQNWDRPFPTYIAETAAQRDITLLIQINPFGQSLAAIARGGSDRYLRTYAAAVRNFHQRVVIGFGHEMNGHWYPWGCGRQPATAFVAAWRHLVTTFRAEGADNVTWLWTISRTTHIKCSVSKYWPGSQYVTWVGVDGYYFYRSDSFQSVFGRRLKQTRRLTHDPILLSEAGIGQIAGQARELPGLFHGIQENHLMGLVWFDVAQHAGLYHQDWQLEGDQPALAAFRRGLAQIYKSEQAGQSG